MSKDLESSVRGFLREFQTKLKVWEVLYVAREKNTQALIDLDITPKFRTKCLEQLTVEDYCEGPKLDKQYRGADLWVFGAMVKSAEVYIKISLGHVDSKVLCISFHIAEHKMNYPLKTK